MWQIGLLTVQLLQAAVKKASEISRQSKNPTGRWRPWRQIITRSAPPPLHWICSMDIEIKAKSIGLGLGRLGNLVVGLQLRGRMRSCQGAEARATARGARCHPRCESPPWSQATARGACLHHGAGPPLSWGRAASGLRCASHDRIQIM